MRECRSRSRLVIGSDWSFKRDPASGSLAARNAHESPLSWARNGQERPCNSRLSSSTSSIEFEPLTVNKREGEREREGEESPAPVASHRGVNYGAAFVSSLPCSISVETERTTKHERRTKRRSSPGVVAERIAANYVQCVLVG